VTTHLHSSAKKKTQHGRLETASRCDACIHLKAFHPFTEVTVDADHFTLLERFKVVMYDKASELEGVNEARKELFCQKGKTMETIPPT